ncbi:MAG: hypothetical protein Q9162_006887 [Coniocarpon cinnabarinum]
MRARRTVTICGWLPLLLFTSLLVLPSTSAQAFPYNPTRLFASTQDDKPFVYVLNPSSSSTPAGSLAAVDISSNFDPSKPSTSTLASSLPFLGEGSSTAYTSSLDPNGAVNVLAGDCTKGASAAALWTFNASATGSNLHGSWAQQSIDSRTISATASQVGVNYLSASVSFAATSSKNASVYTFAGMCPLPNSNDANWVAAAAYSNQLLILDHDQPTEYDFELGSGRGQPISEAGFSITALDPTSSNTSDGTQANQQNFLLLGGHTQDAFINMSQVALFSLPQASWSFLPIGNAGGSSKLRVRQATTDVDPRSGHTAVLSSDGSKVVLFGGWVGDVSTPAEPQLAVLNVGAGYGGAADWSWAAPPTPPNFQGGVSGLFGHGATMLPGNVMLVMGGSTIPAQGKRTKRAGAPAANSQNFLFNISSGQWMNSYVPPPPEHTSESSADKNGLLATKPQKVGLGVGLTFGILAIVIAAIVGWLISKRFKKRLRAREEELREKEIEDLHRFNTPYASNQSEPYTDGAGYQRPANIWDGRGQQNSHYTPKPNIWRNDSVREAERSGLDLDIPSPQRGLRRSVQSRQMHSGRSVDVERRLSRGSGVIHPIAETEEEELTAVALSPSEQLEDPFQDPAPVAGNHAEGEVASERRTPAEQPSASGNKSSEEKTSEMAQWVQNWAAATFDRNNNSGRESPDRSERTQSNLSDRSSVSQLTARTHASSSTSSGRSRPVSTPSPEHTLLPGSRRSLRILPAAFNPFAATSSTSPSSDNHSRGGSFTSSSQPPTTGDSFRTAPTTFQTLQSESDALLGPARPGQARFQPTAKGPPTPKHTSPYTPIAPDNEPTFVLGHRNDAHKAPTGKVGSWVGSVRRAVANAGRSASLTSNGIANVNRQRAMAQVGPSGDGLGGMAVYDVAAGRTEDSPASSPTKKGGVSREYFDSPDEKGQERAEMRRSASEGATTFLVRRKGAKDWGWEGDTAAGEVEVSENEKGKERSQSLATAPRPVWIAPRADAAGHGDGDGDEWDVERAVEARNVQVMFSVPKERLRVVNADIDAASLASGRSVSGQTVGEGATLTKEASR